MRTKLKKKLRLNIGNTTVHSGTNFLGLCRPKFHSYLYLYVSPALGCCRLIWLHMVSCIMARDPHVSSPASVLKLGCNIHLLMKPGQRKKRMFLYFLSNKIFYNNYSSRIQMMLQVFLCCLLLLFFISQ